MKKIKLLLISIHIKESPQAMPLATGLLKARLDSIPGIADNVKVTMAEYYSDTPVEIITESIYNESPDFIGFSIYLWNKQLVEKVCRLVKNQTPGVKIFAGGAEATALPLGLLGKAPFDFVIKGEGELVIAEVFKKILLKENYNNLTGVFSKNEINDSMENQCPVIKLDEIPSPFLTGVIDLQKYSGVLWELSRGCPFKCKFCFESRGVAGVRQFSLERITRELELFETKEVKQVFVLDPTFNRDVNRAKTILKLIKKTAPFIHFTFEVRTEFIDEEMAGLFSQLNCSLQIGLQSAVPEVLANVNRKIDTCKYSEKISTLNQYGVIFGLDLIYGLPGDTIEGFMHSLDYALKLQPNHLDIFPLAVLPGTALYDEAESFNLNYLQDAPYTLIYSPGFSEPAMEKAEILAKACDIFYNKGGAAGWMFMVIETLEIKPSKFLKEFGIYLDKQDKTAEYSRDIITKFQLSFVKEQFEKYNQLDLYPVMEDIIKVNGAFNKSLYAGPYTGASKTLFNQDTVLKKSPGTMFLSLKYNFNELMTVGEYNLEEFLEYYHPENTNIIVYNCHGEIKTLILEDNLFEIFILSKDKIAVKDLILKNKSIDHDELYNFVNYVLAERIFYI